MICVSGNVLSFQLQKRLYFHLFNFLQAEFPGIKSISFGKSKKKKKKLLDNNPVRTVQDFPTCLKTLIQSGLNIGDNIRISIKQTKTSIIVKLFMKAMKRYKLSVMSLIFNCGLILP